MAGSRRCRACVERRGARWAPLKNHGRYENCPTTPAPRYSPPAMRRAAALARRALQPALERPTSWPAALSSRAFACRTKFDAPPPKMARPGGYLSGVAHSAVWRKDHRYKAPPCSLPSGATLTRSRQVLVEYDPKDVDRFIALADALEARGAAVRRSQPRPEAPAGGFPRRAGGGQRRWGHPAVRSPLCATRGHLILVTCFFLVQARCL